jgi:hypothetical protein
MTRKSAVHELPGVDLGFRPRSYFWPLGLETHLLARVKGTERKAALKQLIDAGRMDDIPDFLAHSTLSEADRQALGRIHPAFMGGEYLPDLSQNEVMIASITIASTTQDVTSVYARRGKQRIYYRVVDEYGGETLSGRNTRTSTQPLTLGQLEKFFNGAWSIFDVLEMNFDDYDVARMLDFIVNIESPFYPEIGMLYGVRIKAWAAARRAELGRDQIDGEDLESATTVGSSPHSEQAALKPRDTFPLTSLHEKDRSQSMSTVLAFKNRERSSPAIENGKSRRRVA